MSSRNYDGERAVYDALMQLARKPLDRYEADAILNASSMAPPRLLEGRHPNAGVSFVVLIDRLAGHGQDVVRHCSQDEVGAGGAVLYRLEDVAGVAVILPFADHRPRLHDDVFIAADATVIGRVEIGAQTSIWYGCVVRGDVQAISLGARSNIQDLSVIHVTGGEHPTTKTRPTVIGNEVTVGHRVILHGCTVHDHVLIGMGAVVMDGAVIESDSIVAAGALVTPDTHVPRGSVAMGAPARVARTIREDELRGIDYSWQHYVELARQHAAINP